MGRLIKNHWARLICMTAATYQIAASIEGFFWPKFFFDFLTKNLDGFVKPIPYLQILNLLCGIITLVYEWPLGFVAGTAVQQSLEARLFWLPLTSLLAVLMYQSTNPAIYYLVGLGVYFWAYCDGEVICAVPWTLPRRSSTTTTATAKKVAPSPPLPPPPPQRETQQFQGQQMPMAGARGHGNAHGVPF
ncbi:uncharacterized protein K489DRAFT_316602 [Dissoconium aciculare CBS 342.82]|uniref:DUF7727 domain-containing protein n=1 Tax=Dissoconium aciculare CBS 342.82 TaxID=1314786 RepID=A0A6J3M9D8_9PEZI|nr:uncharacterized protein K489DRAFT_316602 [Dissoconium aciculare CBS 342.82]KAF1824635.1 hypothetical protein K489DRAFT_316602 [Dissoconium aciculare CBS 342.82]